MKENIFLTRLLPDPVMVLLKRRFHLSYNAFDRPLSKREVMRQVGKVQGLISMLNDNIDREVMGAAPRLRIISNYAAGYNNINLSEASRRDVVVTNTPGVLTEATADLTWGLILAVARRIPESERSVRFGKWTGWAPTQFLGGDVYGKTLGIIGMGRIGKAVAKRAFGFSMKVVYHCRHRLPTKEEKHLNARYLPLRALLSQSDFVSLHLPLTETSYHLMGKKAFHLMKQTAFLINTARGPVVDEKALIEALEKKKIAGAGFDVYENEPRVPARLMKIKKIVVLPHIGSASMDTRIRMGQMVFKNLTAFFSGGKMPSRINS